MPLNILSNTNSSPCYEINDTSILKIRGTDFIRGAAQRDPQPQAARLSRQFITQNSSIFHNFNIDPELYYDGSEVNVIIRTGPKIGALPLISPTSGQPDYGMVIKPRFGWAGLGPMLCEMGWKIIPTPLKLPLLPKSEKKIPPWVLSSIILFRIKQLLDSMDRRFEFEESDQPAPRGQVQWDIYLTERIPNAKFLNVPCRFPNLRDDREIQAAIHFTLKKQLSSLETQRASGLVVLSLIDLCYSLLEKVRAIPPKQPTSKAIFTWNKGPFRSDIFRKGLQAIEWTAVERGLAGLADLQGLPWVLSLTEFFEAWVETFVKCMAKRIGGSVTVGRKRETITPFFWDPPYIGSQKYLLPDVVLDRENETIIFDAKYKDHWEELNIDRWSNLEEELRKQHRFDIMQVLAYSTLSDNKKVTCCLVYPCKKSTWESLKQRRRLIHKASLYAGTRKIDLILTAIPMSDNITEPVEKLSEMLL